MDAKITYLANSGFMAELNDVILVFDYEADPAHNVKKTLENNPDKPVVFFVSHNHQDHFNKAIFDLGQNHRRLYVLSNDVTSRFVLDILPVDWMSKGDIIEDLPGGIRVEAFGSTDKGVSYLLTFKDGSKMFHAGDLNNWHWDQESTEREVAKAKEAFTVIVNRIASENPRIDVAFFPVDVRQGENCAAGASQFLETIDVANFFPMHFKGDYHQACSFDEYKVTPAVRERTTFHCLHTPGEHTVIK